METLDEAADKVANWSDRDWNRTVRKAFMSGAEWMRSNFTLHGTTECNESDCFSGRATLYATLGGKCIECAHLAESRQDQSK